MSRLAANGKDAEMSGQNRTEPNWHEGVRVHDRVLAIGLFVLASCQGFPGAAANSGAGLLGDDVLSTVVKGMSPSDQAQLKQHRLALQIKKAGGDVTHNMALYPASTIVAVDLHQTQITDADLAQLKSFPNLRTLNLYNTHITDAGLANVANLTGVQTLHLGNTEITDAGLRSLQSLPDLHELGLTHTKVSDQGMAYLANMKGLTELTLSGGQITDAGLNQLKTLNRLRKIVLSKTNVTKTGVQQLQRALPEVHVFFG
jgi:Leucine-rich repeat (LRR) protein